jgi:ABC-2 type transport system permease protein
MLVLGILGSGSEYKHKTIIPAMLAAPRRGTLVTAKVIGIAVAGALLSTLTFGSGLAVAVAELSAHHLHHLPADTGTLFRGSVVTSILFGVVGVALGYITRSAIAAIVRAVGWVLSAELVILRTVARTWPSGWSPAPPLPSPTPGCSPIMPSPRPLPSRSSAATP